MSIYSFSRLYLFSGILGVLFILFGTSQMAHAQTATACQPSSGGFVPYVYEDSDLHSFDYFYNNQQQLALSKVTVAGIEIPHNYSTFWKIPQGTKVHVDVPSWYGLSGVVPVQIYTVSSSGCTETRSFSITLPTKKPVLSHPTNPSYPTTQKPVAQQNESSGGKGSQEKNTQASDNTLQVQCVEDGVVLSWVLEKNGNYVIERKTSETPFRAIKIVPSEGTPNYTDTQLTEEGTYTYRIRGFDGIKFFSTSNEVTCTFSPQATASTDTECSSWPAPVWIALLILHIVIALLVIDMLTQLLIGNGWRFTVALFIPFAVLLLVWFFFDKCRAYQWFPIIVTLLTLLLLLTPLLWGPKKSRQLTLTEN